MPIVSDYFSAISGSIKSGNIGNSAVVSGNISSGSIGFYHLASGVISTATLGSGQVISGSIGNAAVVSGSIASGQISGPHIASGVLNSISGNFSVTSGSTKLNNILIDSTIFSGLTSTTVVYNIPANQGMAAFFDYAAKNDSTNGYRAGTVTSIWDDTSASSEFNDVSTPDLGGSTLDLTFSTSILSGNLQLSANISSGLYNIKVGIRLI